MERANDGHRLDEEEASRRAPRHGIQEKRRPDHSASSSTQREARRWAYVCGRPDPVRLEVDRDGDGAVVTWTWDPETRVLTERSAPDTIAAEYRFDCAP